MKKLFLFSLFFCLFSPVWADVSPKPEMEFSFIYNTQAKPLIDPVHSEQIQCKDNQCIESTPLGVYGLQKLYCSSGECFSIAYEYDNFQKLIIAFADGTKRESNVFAAPDTLRTRFNVYVNEKNLQVELSPAKASAAAWARRDAWVSLLIILVLELLAAAAYLVYVRKSFVILYSVAAVNVLTTALTWMVLARFVKETAILWLFCLFAEALFIRLVHPRRMSLSDSFFLSLTMNVTSYSLGTMISFVLAPLIF